MMQKHKNIKALFFLGIFSLLLMHQAIPHLHHQHEVEHTHKTATYFDNHGHEHGALTIIKENLKKKFLDFFLGVHAHSVASGDILLIHENVVKEVDVKKDVNTSNSANYYSFSISYDKVEKIPVYHPPITYFNPYLSFLDLRGPPSLG